MFFAYGVNKAARLYAERNPVTFVTTFAEALDDNTSTLSLNDLLNINVEDIKKIIVFSTSYDEIINTLVNHGIPVDILEVYDFYTETIYPLRNVIQHDNPSSNEVLTCFYDLKYCHATFDFLYFLIKCNSELVKSNKKYLEIIIVPKFTYTKPHINIQLGNSEGDLKQRLNGIILQMLSCCKNVVGVHQPVCRLQAFKVNSINKKDFFPQNYLSKKVMKLYSLGDIDDEFFKSSVDYSKILTPTNFAIETIDKYLSKAKSKKIICITLRDYGHQTHRKSNYKEWANFIASLDPDEYFPVIVKDTYSVYSEEMNIPNIFEPASFDLKLRIALYARADLNLSVNCGPSALFYFIKDCRSIEFRMVDNQSLSTSKEHMSKVSKMYEGIQPIYGNNGKNIVYWGKDTFKNISRAFKEYMR